MSKEQHDSSVDISLELGDLEEIRDDIDKVEKTERKSTPPPKQSSRIPSQSLSEKAVDKTSKVILK